MTQPSDVDDQRMEATRTASMRTSRSVPRADVLHWFAGITSAIVVPCRLEILERIQQRPHSVMELVHALDVGQSLVSYHLRVLRSLGIVEFHRRKTQHIYSLRPGLNIRFSRADVHLEMKTERGSRLGVWYEREPMHPEHDSDDRTRGQRLERSRHGIHDRISDTLTGAFSMVERQGNQDNKNSQRRDDREHGRCGGSAATARSTGAR